MISADQFNIEPIVEIAEQAGCAISKISNTSELNVEIKNNQSPVTQADLAAHNIIQEKLLALYPEIPILSEESTQEMDYETRKNWKIFWLVDPLDGTKEFIKGNGQYTVNIALIADNQPILGVIHAPALNTTYFAQQNAGAFKKINNHVMKLPLINNEAKTIRIVVSKSHLNQETEDFIEYIENKVGEVERVSIGSSLKFCLLAEGAADIYPRLGPTMEWDTGAGHIIATETEHTITQYPTGNLLEYNKSDLKNPMFCVQSPRVNLT